MVVFDLKKAVHRAPHSEVRGTLAGGDQDGSLFPLVSVVITTYGDPSTLSRAIDSVLKQSYPNIEIIVVDDNGVSGAFRSLTELVMSRYSANQRILYLCHDENLNGASARNTGIKKSQGSYITFLDNDDLMLSDRVFHAVKALEASDADVYFCDVAIISRGKFAGLRASSSGSISWRDLIVDSNCMGTGSNIFLSRYAVDRAGLFDTSFRRNQDVEYMVRILAAHKSVWKHCLDLVKDEGTTDNEQSVEDYIRTQEHFDKVFSDTITLLSARESLNRLINREREIRYLAIKEHDKASVLASFERVKLSGGKSRRIEKIISLFRCSGLPFSRVVESAARCLRGRNISREISADKALEIIRLLHE